MGVRAAIALCSVCTLALANPAFAEPSLLEVSIRAGPLTDGLQSLERQTGMELLFDHDAVSGVQSPTVQGNLTAETALRQLLVDTSLSMRRAQSGAWIVERLAAPPLAKPDAVVPEILVVGQRTQNADIRRFDNDVQPYTIATKEQIRGTHRDDLGQYFSTFITSNAQVPPGSANASVTSQIDLRGLGSQDTLVLVDGRRMSSLPPGGQSGDLGQPDLNAIPLHAIARIEVLTGAAGGIYGFGALGGVVNVVLDRETRGLDLHLTQGVSSRGDAFRQGVEASFGHTSEDGRTDLTLSASHSQSDTLRAGQRDFLVHDRELNSFFSGETLLAQQPPGNSITVVSLASNLVLKPAYGGAALASPYTYLPSGFSGTPAALAASLLQHAGKVDYSLAPGDADSDLGSNPRTESLFADLRHRFGPGMEAYADVVALWNRGESNNRASNGEALIGAASPANPFTGDILTYFPISNMDLHSSTGEATARYTLGLEAGLPFGWRGTAEVTLGSLRYEQSVSADVPSQTFLILFGLPSDPAVGPLGDWNAFQQEMSANPGQAFSDYVFHNNSRDYSVRLAGPLLGHDEGAATLTILAERRTEDIPAYTQNETSEIGGTTTDFSTVNASQSTDTTSVYAELRARPLDKRASSPLAEGLELQVAVRRDDRHQDFTNNVIVVDEAGIGTVEASPAAARFVGTAYTAGAKTNPWPWLMLRASYATGQQPPPVIALTDEQIATTTLPLATDPKRGGQNLGADGPYVWTAGGNEALKDVHASTLFLGGVLTPLGGDGPRLALDYSRIRKTGDIETLTPAVLMANEDHYPQLITRGPLTAADRALGYMAGPVIALDTRDLNGAETQVEAFDMRAAWPLPFFAGRLRLYVDATYYMKNVEAMPFQPAVESAGYLNGPLKWRGNCGVDWSMNRLTIGANLQYFGRYLMLESGRSGAFNDLALLYQGADHVPSQRYLDLHANWRLPIGDSSRGHDLTLDFGVINVLDTAPPRQSSLILMGGGMEPGYSPYGDPRRRRFDLVLSQHF